MRFYLEDNTLKVHYKDSRLHITIDDTVDREKLLELINATINQLEQMTWSFKVKRLYYTLKDRLV